MSYERSKLFVEPSPAPVAEQWRKTLLDAADYIRVHGWGKCEMENRHGNVCVMGAIRRVTGCIGPMAKSWPASYEAEDRFGRFLGNVPDECGIGKIQSWNDDFAGSVDRVLSALESAARS